jgi:hypothetical protein
MWNGKNTENFVPRKLGSVIRFLSAQKYFTHQNSQSLIAVHVDGGMRVQNDVKWFKGFENGRTNFHDDDHTERPAQPAQMLRQHKEKN